jgi:type I restriction-modification system DNA methylase subunit
MVTATKESFAKVVGTLLRKYESDRETYISPEYNETQARSQFITPFLKALGWDVENEAGVPYHLSDLWEEKGETHGRPDYTFRINGQTKFFLEAKAPCPDVSTVSHILQAKRYAWNSRDVFFAGLFDFEEILFFDASLEPDERRARDGEAFHLIFREYLSNVDRLWELSKERVAANSLDQFLRRDRKSIRYRIPVDKKFLDELTEWRRELAGNIHARNAGLDARQLNDIVQRLLDRIVFIRIAEDRKVIEARQLWDIADLWEESGGRRNIMEFLVDLFATINADFNGEIFKAHVCEKVQIDSIMLAKIIRRLYPPKSPYRFDVIGVELLGSIYERYLGNTLSITAKQVRLEPKPEVRKAGGVYYTPKFIVDYIVGETVGKLVEGKTPKEVANLRILDPTCGSGSFLIGAFQYLIDWHLNYYREHGEEARIHPMYPEVLKDADGNVRLSFHAKARIMRQNLYGVDIDPQAVEITMMSLYLKALDGEREMLAPKQSVLPELKFNIRCGNSIVGPEITEKFTVSQEERDRIKTFNWKAVESGFGDILANGGFDAVIGNPPYGDTLSNLEKKYLVSAGYKSGGSGNNDIFRFMVEKGLHVLRDACPLGMILPNTYLVGSKYRNFRETISQLALVDEIVDFGTQKVFDVEIFSSILILQRRLDVVNEPHVKARFLADGRPPVDLLAHGTPISLTQSQLSASDWIPPDPVLERIRSRPDFVRIDTICEIKDAGINYQRVGVGWQHRAKSKLASKILYEGKKRHRSDKGYIKGEDIERYRVKPESLSKRWLRHDFKRFVGAKEVVAFGKDILEAPQKIVSRQTGDSIIAALDDRRLYTGRSLHSWRIKEGAEASLGLVLGVLNSRLMTYLYRAVSREEGRALAQVKLNKLKLLPFPDLRKLPDQMRRLCGEIERIVNDIRSLQQTSTWSSDVAPLAAKIDKLVYQLYEITPADPKR